MSIDNTSTTSSTDLTITNNEPLFIGSDVMMSDDLTQKQRSVLLAASSLYSSPDVSISAIGRHADVAPNYARYVLATYMERFELPSDCNLLERCTATKSYDDLTDIQRQIVNERALHDDFTETEIADEVGCTQSMVHQTLVFYDDIVEQLRDDLC